MLRAHVLSGTLFVQVLLGTAFMFLLDSDDNLRDMCGITGCLFICLNSNMYISLSLYIYIYISIHIYIYIYYYSIGFLPGTVGLEELYEAMEDERLVALVLRSSVACCPHDVFCLFFGRGMIRLETLIELKLIDSSCSSSNFSIRAFRAYPLVGIKQIVPCRAIRGKSSDSRQQ